MAIQMNRKELTKTFIMILNLKNPLVFMGYTKIFNMFKRCTSRCTWSILHFRTQIVGYGYIAKTHISLNMLNSAGIVTKHIIHVPQKTPFTSADFRPMLTVISCFALGVQLIGLSFRFRHTPVLLWKDSNCLLEKYANILALRDSIQMIHITYILVCTET